MTNNDNLHKADQVYFLYDPQPVRLLDVIYVGPVMIYAGIKGKNLNAFVKWSLIGVGICTILYNGANFFINEKKAYQRRKDWREAAEEQLSDALGVATESLIAKKSQDDDLTEAIIQDNLPIQVPVEQQDNNDFEGIDLPKELLHILKAPQQTSQSPKKRGRPAKKVKDQNITKQENVTNSQNS